MQQNNDKIKRGVSAHERGLGGHNTFCPFFDTLPFVEISPKLNFQSIIFLFVKEHCLKKENVSKRKGIKTVLRGIDSFIGLLIRRPSAGEMKMKIISYLRLFPRRVLHFIRESFGDVNNVLMT